MSKTKKVDTEIDCRNCHCEPVCNSRALLSDLIEHTRDELDNQVGTPTTPDFDTELMNLIYTFCAGCCASFLAHD